MRNRNECGESDMPIGCAVLVLGAIVLFVALAFISALHVEHHDGCVVSDKDRTSDGNGGSDARVYTENCGNFKVDDSLLSGTWHSSDTYAGIEVGHTYDFTTRGWRVPFLSWFPNIVGVDEVQ